MGRARLVRVRLLVFCSIQRLTLQAQRQGRRVGVRPSVPHQHVPTWNYAMAVATGRAERLNRAQTRAVLWELCAQFEPPDGYRPDWIKRELLDELLEAIVGIEVHVEDFTAKLKLSQNRHSEDRAGVLKALASEPYPRAPELLRWMQRAGG